MAYHATKPYSFDVKALTPVLKDFVRLLMLYISYFISFSLLVVYYTLSIKISVQEYKVVCFYPKLKFSISNYITFLNKTVSGYNLHCDKLGNSKEA